MYKKILIIVLFFNYIDIILFLIWNQLSENSQPKDWILKYQHIFLESVWRFKNFQN